MDFKKIEHDVLYTLGEFDRTSSETLPEYFLGDWRRSLKNERRFLFDEKNLIYSKEVNIKTSNEHANRKMFLDESDLFIKTVDKYLTSIGEENKIFLQVLNSLLVDFKVTDRLTKSQIEKLERLENSDKLDIRFNEGEKIYKAVNKTINKINGNGNIKSFFSISFEKLNLLKSQIKSTETIKGKLSISVHPMDFLTASYNDCDWTSCLDIYDGDFFLGAASLIGSDQAFCIHLESKKEMPIGKIKWNSKKWRVFGFINKENEIYIGKQYPFESDELMKKAIELIKETSGIDYLVEKTSDNFYSNMYLSTELLYNDSERNPNGYLLKEKDTSYYKWVADKGIKAFDNGEELKNDWPYFESPLSLNMSYCESCESYIDNNYMYDDEICLECYEEYQECCEEE